MHPRIFMAVLGGLLLCPVAARAQEEGGDGSTVQLENLQSPASPGFVILGVEPSSVARPTSPRGVAMSFISAVRDGGDLVPRNYAVEVAPYWLAPHPDLTFSAYNEASFKQTVQQTTSVSLATTSIATSDKDPESLGIGLGLHALLSQGYLSRQAENLLNAIDSLQVAMLRADNEEEENQLNEATRVVALQFQKAARERVGLLLEAAIATSFLFPQSSYDDGRVSRVGAWATTSYRSNGAFQGTAVFRYLRDRTSVADADLDVLDLGARLHYVRDPLDSSFEIVRRWTDQASGLADDTSSFRAMGIVHYRLAPSLRVTVSLGKDYEDPARGDSPMVSLLGLDIGISEMPVLQTRGEER
jgi:hypothetical protein